MDLKDSRNTQDLGAEKESAQVSMKPLPKQHRGENGQKDQENVEIISPKLRDLDIISQDNLEGIPEPVEEVN